MQFARNISLTVLTAIILFSNNGFILERYLCLGCKSEHKEIVLFEFGELKHQHNPCEECSSQGHECDCCNNISEHKANTDVEYIYLDLLFFNDNDTNAKYLIPQIIIKNFGFDNHSNFLQDNFSNKIITLFKLLKIPPLISKFKSSLDFCTKLSVFRL